MLASQSRTVTFILPAPLAEALKLNYNHIMPTGNIWRAQNIILTVVSLCFSWQLKELKLVSLINSVKNKAFISQSSVQTFSGFRRKLTELLNIVTNQITNNFGNRIQRFNAANDQPRQNQFRLLYTLKSCFKKMNFNRNLPSSRSWKCPFQRFPRDKQE
jgi:hypothetical protein